MEGVNFMAVGLAQALGCAKPLGCNKTLGFAEALGQGKAWVGAKAWTRPIPFGPAPWPGGSEARGGAGTPTWGPIAVATRLNRGYKRNR